jgi:hypothetical protein
MAKKGKMTEEEKAKLPEAFRKNMGRIRRLPTEEQRKMQDNGGQANADRLQRIKEWQESMKGKMTEYALMFLDTNMLPGVKKIYAEFNLPAEDATNMMAIFMGMGRKAQQGDATAAKFIFEVAGIYTETKNLNINGNVPTGSPADLSFVPAKKD